MSDERVIPGGELWAEGVRRMRELGEQINAAGRTMAMAVASMAPPALSQPLARYAEQMMTVSDAFTAPLRALLAEQHRFAERMAEWAEQHRAMSETIDEWVAYQRQINEQLDELAKPFLDQSELLAELHAEWSRRAAGSADGD